MVPRNKVDDVLHWPAEREASCSEDSNDCSDVIPAVQHALLHFCSFMFSMPCPAMHAVFTIQVNFFFADLVFGKESDVADLLAGLASHLRHGRAWDVSKIV